MGTTLDDVVEVARTWKDVRWQHQGRTRHGIDCIGLPIVCAWELGISTYNIIDYGRVPNGRKLQKIMDTELNVEPGPLRPGFIVLMRFERTPIHVGIITPVGLLHAYAVSKKVVEHRIDDMWRSRIVKAYSYKGLANG